jgi:hypothetical protein
MLAPSISFLGPQKQHLSGRHFNPDEHVQKIQRASEAITDNPKGSLDDMDTLIAKYERPQYVK